MTKNVTAKCRKQSYEPKQKPNRDSPKPRPYAVPHKYKKYPKKQHPEAAPRTRQSPPKNATASTRNTHLEPVQASLPQRASFVEHEHTPRKVRPQDVEVRGDRVRSTSKVHVVREVDDVVPELLSDVNLYGSSLKQAFLQVRETEAGTGGAGGGGSKIFQYLQAFFLFGTVLLTCMSCRSTKSDNSSHLCPGYERVLLICLYGARGSISTPLTDFSDALPIPTKWPLVGPVVLIVTVCLYIEVPA